MKTSARGIELIKQFEGLELEAYQDIAGIWTIGYGHTGPDVEPGMRISEREAEALLRKDLKPREDAARDLTSVKLNQNEFDALVSFIYNVGVDAYRRSTARRRLNRNDRLGAADALTWWNKATVGGVLRQIAGLTRRRAAERALFLTPTNPPIVREPNNIAENSRVTPIEDTPRRDNIAESRTVQGATVAGGAGVAASTMGRDSAEELDEIEDNIAAGRGADNAPPADEQSSPPASDTPPAAVDEPAGDPSVDIEDPTTAPDADDDAIDDAGEPATTDDSIDVEPPATAIDESETEIDAGENIVAETDDGAVTDDELVTTSEIILDDTAPERPTKLEVHAVEAQIQFALLILIVLAVLFVIIARIDDWRNYRR